MVTAPATGSGRSGASNARYSPLWADIAIHGSSIAPSRPRRASVPAKTTDTDPTGPYSSVVGTVSGTFSIWAGSVPTPDSTEARAACHAATPYVAPR